MIWTGELLHPTDAERVRFVITIIDLIRYVRTAAGRDLRMRTLLTQYESELEELTIKSKPSTEGTMTTKQIVARLQGGEKISLSELHRLEKRLAGLLQQVKDIESAMKQCYSVRDRVRTPNPQLVDAI